MSFNNIARYKCIVFDSCTSDASISVRKTVLLTSPTLTMFIGLFFFRKKVTLHYIRPRFETNLTKWIKNLTCYCSRSDYNNNNNQIAPIIAEPHKVSMSHFTSTCLHATGGYYIRPSVWTQLTI